jgi:hypothetical protein
LSSFQIFRPTAYDAKAAAQLRQDQLSARKRKNEGDRKIERESSSQTAVRLLGSVARSFLAKPYSEKFGHFLEVIWPKKICLFILDFLTFFWH